MCAYGNSVKTVSLTQLQKAIKAFMQDQLMTDVQGQFLIAMPGLEDELFHGSLIYILEHTSEGAVGLIINKQLDISVDEVLNQIDDSYDESRFPQLALEGGPVSNNRGFVVHTKQSSRWQHQVQLAEGLFLTTSADILEQLAKGEDIGEFVLALGYAGWSPGQLEQEIADNAWLSVDNDQHILFNTDIDKRLNAAAANLGINYDLLSATAGNA